MKAIGGGYDKKEIFIDIYTSKDESIPYSLIRKIPINLTKYIDLGKTDDTIIIDDLGLMLLFDVELT